MTPPIELADGENPQEHRQRKQQRRVNDRCLTTNRGHGDGHSRDMHCIMCTPATDLDLRRMYDGSIIAPHLFQAGKAEGKPVILAILATFPRAVLLPP